MEDCKKAELPLGIFDSGLGGLTVCSAIRKYLPSENIIYFGDTARVPYGTKSAKTVLRFSRQIAKFLLSKNIKALVIACNTATAHSLTKLQNELPIPVMGVIDPGVRAAYNASEQKKIGIIATRSTIASRRYQSKFFELDESLKVIARATPLLVDIVEEGWAEKALVEPILLEYLENFKSENIDSLVLGCTHFPILKNRINKLYPNWKLIDSSQEVAKCLKDLLIEKNLLRCEENVSTDLNLQAVKLKPRTKVEFYVSDITQAFLRQTQIFFGPDLPKASEIYLDDE